MKSPLNGLKVLDFSTLLPGPFATLYLADLGAKVVHIEAPNRPDLVRLLPPYSQGQATAHSYLNRNKDAVALDLKNTASVDWVKSIIQDYDIVVEQFRPGVMKRLGLDYETLSAINPRLIYCSITGYGQTGSYKDRAGHDINYLAKSGIAGQTGRQNSGPIPLSIQIADVAGGSFHAVIGILSAVIERQSSGLGQYLDISMTDCAVSLHTMAAASTLVGDEKQGPELNHLNGGTFYDYYQTKDGRYISIGSLEPQFLNQLAHLLDLPLLKEKGFSPHLNDQKNLKQEIQAKIETRTWSEWTDFFSEYDVCVEAVLNLDEALQSDLAQERAWVVDVPLDEQRQEYEAQLACPIKFSRSELYYRFRGKTLGADNATYLEE